MAALSYAETTATSGQTTVAVPFPYLDKAHVHISIDDTIIADGELEWASSNLITLPDALEGGETVRVFRLTPAAGLIYQAQPGTIDHRQVNRALLQLLYIVQEAYDSAIEARAISQALLTIFDQVTTLYNAIVAMHAEVVEDYNFITSLKFYFDFNITTPYPPALNEKLGEWKVPMQSRFDDDAITEWGGRMFESVSSGLTMLAYHVVFDDTDPDAPEEVATLLGTFTAAPNNEVISFAKADDLDGPVVFAAGDYLRITMGGTTDSNITGFSNTLRLRRLV